VEPQAINFCRARMDGASVFSICLGWTSERDKWAERGRTQKRESMIHGELLMVVDIVSAISARRSCCRVKLLIQDVSMLVKETSPKFGLFSSLD
jgi:hypothetical protein